MQPCHTVIDAQRGNPLALPERQALEADAALAWLRLSGAEKFDPVHLHYLQVLATRTNAQEGLAKQLLEDKLTKALRAFKARFEQAHAHASHQVRQTAIKHPDAASNLQQQLAEGDFKSIAQHIDALQKSQGRDPLGELVRYLASQSAPASALEVEYPPNSSPGLRPELKATRYFRNTWSKLSVEKRVTQAITQAPLNAGPINAHSLVLRSLAMMREVSPDYLNRFTSYVDTLLCLAQGDQDKAGSVKTTQSAQSSKKSPKLPRPKAPKKATAKPGPT